MSKVAQVAKIGQTIVLTIAVMGLLFVSPNSFVLPILGSPVTPAKFSKLDADMALALKGKSLQEHKDLYKVFAGVAEYSKNAHNFDTTKDVYKSLEEVIRVYDLKGRFSGASSLIDEHLVDLQVPAKFADKKDVVIQKFTELANAVKYSAEQ